MSFDTWNETDAELPTNSRQLIDSVAFGQLVVCLGKYKFSFQTCGHSAIHRTMHSNDLDQRNDLQRHSIPQISNPIFCSCRQQQPSQDSESLEW